VSKRGERAFIHDMLARIDLVQSFTAEGREAFMLSRITQEAVIRSLEVIGEASRNVSAELREAYPDVPWRQIAAFRNFVVHVYWDVRMERIWEIVERDLPALKSQVQALLAALPDESDTATEEDEDA
jgi:uncharacterized protein with HEPN domain